MAPPTVDEFTEMMDNSILFANHTEADMYQGIERTKAAKAGRFVTQPFRIKQAVEALKGTGISVQCWISLPHGLDATASKVAIARNALEDGAGELDMVMNISAAKSGDWDYVQKDLEAVVDVAKDYGVTVKCIIEIFWLTDEEIINATKAAVAAGCSHVKTSSGYTKDTFETVLHAIKLIKANTPPGFGIKGSAATHSAENVCAYLKAGANRFGVYDAFDLRGQYEVLLKEGRTGLE